MTGHARMSPLTALFLGLFGVGAVGIASGTAVVLYGMRIIDSKASDVLGFAEGSLAGVLDTLPELLESLPPTLADVLNDRRVPEYAAEIDIDAAFVTDDRNGGLRPVLTITNNGSEVVSLLAVRVAALNANKVPIREWIEVVATPIAIDGDWRGPLFPGKTRYVVMSGWRGLPAKNADTVMGVAEISEIRVWQSPDES